MPLAALDLDIRAAVAPGEVVDEQRLELAGRLGGSEMARSEKVLHGRFPLQTLRAKIDYGFTEAKTKYGNIGVKVWVNRGLLPPGGRISDTEERRNALDA